MSYVDQVYTNTAVDDLLGGGFVFPCGNSWFRSCIGRAC
ncbi:hypothetical protein C942_04541 [Photobacterium marinum]|uniref:Uncharacterized protein n=1 Tax=Photobacterium marinum TaxID=1056511 RepID=L8JHD2_9GAMM|nr:hypothetical protein C942_04541 [Photobacterium marinum]